MVKAIFFDIDGTLVSFETHKIPASTQEALKTLRDKGIKIFIATGRPQCLINNLGDLEFDGYITVNGSYCFTAGHQPIYKGCIPQEDIERLITFQQKYPVPFVFAYGNEMFVTEVNDRVQAVSDLIEIPVPPCRLHRRSPWKRHPANNGVLYGRRGKRNRYIRQSADPLRANALVSIVCRHHCTGQQ